MADAERIAREAAGMGSVLVLEDDSDLRELLSELLAMVATSCVTAGTLADLEERENEAVACDLALLDVNLGPGEPTGVDASRWLVAHGFRGRIVYVTGHAAADPRIAEAAEQMHALVLTKPVEARMLTELVLERLP